jgi:hypothetical protein
MLLELLDHSEGLFAAVLEHLFAVGDRLSRRSLAALSAANWRLNAAMDAAPKWQHMSKLRQCLIVIRRINIISNEYITIRELNNNITTYSYWSMYRNQSGGLYLGSKNIYFIRSYSKNITYTVKHDMKINMAIDPYALPVYIIVYGKIPTWLHKHEECVKCNAGPATIGYVFYV